MRTGRVTAIAAAVAVLGLSSCGGGSSGTGNGGSLTFRPMWEQVQEAGSAAAVSDQVGETTRGIFGTTLPASVQTVRVILQSDSGHQCCLSVNPDALPKDPVSGQSTLLLSQLPAGGATLTIAGFATNFAPTQGDITDACETESGTGVQACDSTRVATPSFASDPQRVTILGGVETNAGDIAAFAVPFVVSTSPIAGDTTLNPVTVRFTVGDGGAGIDRQSIVVSVTQDGVPVADTAVTATACNDASATRCSGGGSLGVSGYLVTRAAQSLAIGPATVRIQAANLTGRTLDFSYMLQVVSAPEPTPTVPGGIRIVRPGASTIIEAVRSLANGGTVIVAPGVYAPLSLAASDVHGPLTLLGDVSGMLTESPPAPVVLNAGSSGPTLRLSSVSDVTVDGFTCLGGSGAGALVQRSTRTVIRNSVVSSPNGDGIRVENSQAGLLFDNLVANPHGTGIRILGSEDLQIINNTVYNSTASGLVVDSGDAPSDGITVGDNIFDGNRPFGILVAASTGVYDADYNINTDAYGPGTPIGPNDLTGSSSNPLFNFPSDLGGFHLSAGSPAIDAGDPNPAPDLATILAQRTTQTDGSPDIGRIDLGYHYPQVVTPTPTP